MCLTDLELDAVLLSSQADGLFHHTHILGLREGAGGVDDLPTWTRCYDSRPAGKRDHMLIYGV